MKSKKSEQNDKYIISVIKGNKETELEAFDTQEAALEYGDLHASEYPPGNGILVCKYRRFLNLSKKELAKGRSNYIDTDVKEWFDLDAFLKYRRED